MSILYLAQREISLINPDGVCKKMLQQVKVFSKLADSYLIGYDSQKNVAITDGNTYRILKKYCDGSNSRESLYNTAYEFCCNQGIKIVYLRYGFSDKRFICFLKSLKNLGIKIIAEIPTYPYRQEVYGLKAHIKYSIIDRWYCLQLKEYVSRILTYTQDDEIFGIPCIKTMNGILVDEIKIRHPQKNNGEIHIIAVSSMEKWHGYERAIEGLHRYYSANDTNETIILDLVGEGPEKNKYLQLIEQYKLSDKVIMHGFKTGSDLDLLYNFADIALGTLSAYRIGLKSTSALKTREYLAKGIPMISGSLVEGLPNGYNGVMYCSASDEPLDFNKVLAFFHEIYDNTDRNEVIYSIRNDATKYFDLTNLLDELLSIFKEYLNN